MSDWSRVIGHVIVALTRRPLYQACDTINNDVLLVKALSFAVLNSLESCLTAIKANAKVSMPDVYLLFYIVLYNIYSLNYSLNYSLTSTLYLLFSHFIIFALFVFFCMYF